MTLRIGRLGWVGVGFESSYGVPVAVADYLPFTTNTLKGHAEKLDNDAAYGVRERIFGSVSGKKWGEGDFEMDLDSRLSVYLMGAALGSINSVNVSGSIYDHTISRNNSNVPKSLTLVNDRGVDREYYHGAAVSKLELSVTDGLALAKASIMSRFPITTTSGTLTTTSGSLYAFKDSTFAFGASVAAAQAATNLKLHEMKVTIDNNTRVVHRHGNNDVDVVNHGEFAVEAEGTLFFENTTTRDAFYNNNKQAASWQFSGLGIGGGLSESLKVNFYQCRTDTWELETGLADFFAEKFKLVAEYDNANTASFAIVARNTKTSY